MFDTTREVQWLDQAGHSAALELSYALDALDHLTDEVALTGAAHAAASEPYDNADEATWLAGVFTQTGLDAQHTRIATQVALALDEMSTETRSHLLEAARLVQADATLNAYASHLLASVVLEAADLARQARTM